jgi:hypothetical protein
VLGIGAHRGDAEQLLDPVTARLLDDVQPHRHVRVEEPARLGAVRADPADLGREMRTTISGRLASNSARTASALVRSQRFRRGTQSSRVPRSSSCAQTRRPRNPAPPVTRIRRPRT